MASKRIQYLADAAEGARQVLDGQQHVLLIADGGHGPAAVVSDALDRGRAVELLRGAADRMERPGAWPAVVGEDDYREELKGLMPQVLERGEGYVLVFVGPPGPAVPCWVTNLGLPAPFVRHMADGVERESPADN